MHAAVHLPSDGFKNFEIGLVEELVIHKQVHADLAMPSCNSHVTPPSYHSQRTKIQHTMNLKMNLSNEL
jgi:hypothetical protein